VEQVRAAEERVRILEKEKDELVKENADLLLLFEATGKSLEDELTQREV
jgi:hypothetical protein